MSDEEIDLQSEDSDLVQQIAENGAIVVILDFPIGSEFGIDMKQWETGEKFRGVKMIPPGVHFIYYSNVCEGTVAPRSGFFHNFSEKELVAFRWNVKEEILEEVSPDDHSRLVGNKKELDKFLGSYPYDVYKKWLALSDKMTAELVERLQPEEKIIHSAPQLLPQQKSDSTTSQDGLPNMEEIDSSKLKFTKFPDRRHPEGATTAEISRCGMDGSYTLKCLLKTAGNSPNDLLGELQFAFVVFLCGQRFGGFEQWKRIVRIVCTSETAMSEPGMETFFSNFISVLHFHLKEVPPDFFLDIVSRENFLTDSLSLFFRNIAESSTPDKQLAVKAERFRRHLTKYFKWDFDQEDDEDQPQIVELD